MKSKKVGYIKTIISLVVIAVCIALIIYLFPIMKNISTQEGRQAFKEVIQNTGFKGVLVFFGLEVAQIFLFILPGEPLEILAGMCYGEVWGTVFILVSVCITTTIIFFLVRKYGKDFLYNFFSEEKIKEIEEGKLFKNEKNIEYLLIILFMIPGTPKDLLTYVGGILPIKPSRFIAIATLARLPSIISSTLAGANIVKGKWLTMVIVYIVPLLIAIIFIGIMKFLEKRKESNEQLDVN